MDAARLKANFAHVAMHGDEVPLFFYSDLFIRNPQVRDLFPVSMAAQRDHLMAALGRIVASVDRAGEITGFLQGLGRDHRKFGVLAEHYDALGTSLLATIAYFSGDTWTPDLAADWRQAYELIAGIMRRAAADDEAEHPPYWTGTVLSCERPAFDVSVLRVRPDPPLGYLPGQSVAVEVPSRPRLWRYYSIANAPRPDGTLEFHVRMVDGGAVSMALTRELPAGAQLRLGPPVGALTLDAASGRDILLIAGSTGLAPLKALAEQVAGLASPPRVHLFFGARTAEGLYDLPGLLRLAREHPWLTVVPVVADGRRSPGETGRLADVVARHGDWSARDAYLAGPSEMVREVQERLVAAGMPGRQVHVEDFGWSEP